ncbi:lysophospholipid acyltransferase family protein [Lignipirellula cremea]|uniref:Acyltransferase n=1 Tax=Lignipirellula cremea TaxID=2528010 RepID=A0A518DQN9_9BACT|nr:lysophospholipid acyltransferase family protein [Lignipirellula cremea]QDU94160.1 Acyltransferase [Lignipirellula cremea]
MNRQPYGLPPKWWPPQMSQLWVRWTRRYRWSQLRRSQRIVKIDVQGGEHLTAALQSGAGVMITPNHSAHYDSAALYIAADRLNTPLYFMTAWQVFAMSSSFERLAMQRLGCFSIDRESNDRQAFKTAIDLLQHAGPPLVVFPEGDIYHVTDRVTPFREGAAAMALHAAKKAEREIAVVPCAIKFWYVNDPSTELFSLLDLLEERMFLRPLHRVSLTDRIHRIAEATLALKELDYLGRTASGRVRDRIGHLTEAILQQLEQRHELKPGQGNTPERAKALRQLIIRKADDMRKENPSKNGDAPPAMQQEFRRLESDMDDVFFIMQLYSYPGDYLVEIPTLERLAETLDKFEEDILQRDLPRVRGQRRVQIRFGPPLTIEKERKGRDQVAQLTHQMEAQVQALIDQINAEEGLKPHVR